MTTIVINDTDLVTRCDISRSFRSVVSISRFAILACTSAIGGCAALFPIEAGKSLPHFSEVSPKEGSRAPDFQLMSLDGESVDLQQLLGDKPIVIQLGSYTCPVFRYRRFDMIPLRVKYKGRVTFLVIYTQEAHPVGYPSPYSDDEWVPWMNIVAGIDVGQPESFEARMRQARFAQQSMSSNARFLVDDMDNGTWIKLGRAPSAAYVLDLHGRVVLRQPWVYPMEIDRTLARLLDDM